MDSDDEDETRTVVDLLAAIPAHSQCHVPRGTNALVIGTVSKVLYGGTGEDEAGFESIDGDDTIKGWAADQCLLKVRAFRFDSATGILNDTNTVAMNVKISSRWRPCRTTPIVARVRSSTSRHGVTWQTVERFGELEALVSMAVSDSVGPLYALRAATGLLLAAEAARGDAPLPSLSCVIAGFANDAQTWQDAQATMHQSLGAHVASASVSRLDNIMADLLSAEYAALFRRFPHLWARAALGILAFCRYQQNDDGVAMDAVELCTKSPYQAAALAVRHADQRGASSMDNIARRVFNVRVGSRERARRFFTFGMRHVMQRSGSCVIRIRDALAEAVRLLNLANAQAGFPPEGEAALRDHVMALLPYTKKQMWYTPRALQLTMPHDFAFVGVAQEDAPASAPIVLVTPQPMHLAEAAIAATVAKAVAAPPREPGGETAVLATHGLGVDMGVPPWMSPLPDEFGHAPRRRLDETQLRFVTSFLQKNSFALLTGPGGTGKTNTMVVAVDALLAADHAVVVCGFMGKAMTHARKNLGSVCAGRLWGGGPMTIHSFKARSEGASAPTKPLALVVDEASMLSTAMLASLMTQWPWNRILLVGDPFQIPPIDPGCPFHTMLAPGSPLAPYTTELTHIYRRTGDGISPIVRAAKVVRSIVSLAESDANPTPHASAAGAATGAGPTDPMTSLLACHTEGVMEFIPMPSDQQLVDDIVAVYLDSGMTPAPRPTPMGEGGPTRAWWELQALAAGDVIVQSPYNAAVAPLNIRVRERLNPAQRTVHIEARLRRPKELHEADVPHDDRWRRGDRAMCLKNTYARFLPPDGDRTNLVKRLLASNGDSFTVVCEVDVGKLRRNVGWVPGGTLTMAPGAVQTVTHGVEFTCAEIYDLCNTTIDTDFWNKYENKGVLVLNDAALFDPTPLKPGEPVPGGRYTLIPLAIFRRSFTLGYVITTFKSQASEARVSYTIHRCTPTFVHPTDERQERRFPHIIPHIMYVGQTRARALSRVYYTEADLMDTLYRSQLALECVNRACRLPIHLAQAFGGSASYNAVFAKVGERQETRQARLVAKEAREEARAGGGGAPPTKRAFHMD